MGKMPKPLKDELAQVFVLHDVLQLLADVVAVDGQRFLLHIGARRLHTILERLLEDISFEAPDVKKKSLTIDGDYVRQKLQDITQNEDLSKFIL